MHNGLTKDALIEFFDHHTAAWNNGDLESFCSIYAPGASFISGGGNYTRGRDTILERYRTAYPDRTAMGTLSLELLEFVGEATDQDAGTKMASAILAWKLVLSDGTQKSGYSLIVAVVRDGETCLVQDASV